MKKKLSLSSSLLESFMILLSLVFLYPIVFMIMAAFRTRLDFANAPAGMPKTFTVDNIVEAFNRMNFIRVFTNSFFITSVSVIIILFIGSMASYGISRWNSKKANYIYLFFVTGMLIPIQICMVPLYKLMADLGLISNPLS